MPERRALLFSVLLPFAVALLSFGCISATDSEKERSSAAASDAKVAIRDLVANGIPNQQ